ncbi:uncharacterized protein RSE6_11033 [Rhynchosporium secalis]|uniref:Uncharacterized protein n=1 Tax=Rhynchosporium secalis TaxID=38038 RepID=A0A1E1MLY0_RHYSE|nr:uncharacterized protein RSE6_11033 [Rhynchosporium secalis]
MGCDGPKYGEFSVAGEVAMDGGGMKSEVYLQLFSAKAKLEISVTVRKHAWANKLELAKKRPDTDGTTVRAMTNMTTAQRSFPSQTIFDASGTQMLLIINYSINLKAVGFCQTVKGEFNARRDHKGRLFLEAGCRKLYRPTEAQRLSRRPSAKSPDDR